MASAQQNEVPAAVAKTCAACLNQMAQDRNNAPTKPLNSMGIEQVLLANQEAILKRLDRLDAVERLLSEVTAIHAAEVHQAEIIRLNSYRREINAGVHLVTGLGYLLLPLFKERSGGTYAVGALPPPEVPFPPTLNDLNNLSYRDLVTLDEFYNLGLFGGLGIEQDADCLASCPGSVRWQVEIAKRHFASYIGCAVHKNGTV